MKSTFRPWQTLSRMAKRYRSTFIINLVGLSTGLACALLIFLWISDELAVDKFHRYDNRLYQVMVNQRQGDQINTSDGTNGLLGEIIRKGLPEVEYAVSTTPPYWFKKFNVTWRNNTVGAVGNFVGQDYFNVFSYALLQGNRNSVLTDRHAIVLSRGLAMKLFNTTDNIIGKTLEWKWASVSKQVTVTGICADFPSNSSYRFDFVLSLDSWKDVLNAGENQRNGPSTGPFSTFLVLREHTDPASFDAKLNNFSSVKFDRTPVTLFLRKYSDAWLHGRYENGVAGGGKNRICKAVLGDCLFYPAHCLYQFYESVDGQGNGKAEGDRAQKDVWGKQEYPGLSVSGRVIINEFHITAHCPAAGCDHPARVQWTDRQTSDAS